ncbi:MAG: S9 family peptidase [Gemmatales bacterium]|nr:S9 family peptidase [Gemmatales bacterium]MDW7994481.1 S9 family peptidase [Gemmatales bacterium]
MNIPHYSIERFLNIQAASSPTFSPDGHYLAFLTNITGLSQVWQVPIIGGWPTRLTFTQESVRGVWYSPVSHELIFSQDTGGNERTQLFHLRGVGVAAEHGLTDGWDYYDLSRSPEAIHLFGAWRRDGKWVCFAANRLKPDRFDIYIQGAAPNTEPTLVQTGPGGYYVPVSFSPDGRSVLVSRPESNYNQDLYLLDLSTKQARHLTPHQGHAQYESPRFSPDGKFIYCVSTHGGRDLLALARIELSTGKLEYIHESPHEIEAVELALRGPWLAWLENQDGRSVLVCAHRENLTKRFSPHLPLGTISQLEFSPDGSKLAFVFNGPRYNPDIWLLDLNTQQAKQLTFSSRAGIPFSTLVEPELVRYKSFDGLTIPAWYYAPRDVESKRLPPVIVYPHGGPESQTRPEFSALFQYFLQAGYGIFAPNFRGSSGYGLHYMNLDNVTKRLDAVKDVIWGVYWLRDQKKADPRRIAIYGGSYGGFIVLACVTRYPELFAAGISVVGIANFVTFLENTGPYRRAHREAEYGNLREHRTFLEEISPIRHVDKIQCPMMIIHGANDPRVPIGEAEQIIAALRKRNIPVEYLRYEDEGHGLAKLKNRLDAYPKMVNFLDKYVKAK